MQENQLSQKETYPVPSVDNLQDLQDEVTEGLDEMTGEHHQCTMGGVGWSHLAACHV